LDGLLSGRRFSSSDDDWLMLLLLLLLASCCSALLLPEEAEEPVAELIERRSMPLMAARRLGIFLGRLMIVLMSFVLRLVYYMTCNSMYSRSAERHEQRPDYSCSFYNWQSRLMSLSTLSV
jgi:hypothetical protein